MEVHNRIYENEVAMLRSHCYRLNLNEQKQNQDDLFCFFDFTIFIFICRVLIVIIRTILNIERSSTSRKNLKR